MVFTATLAKTARYLLARRLCVSVGLVLLVSGCPSVPDGGGDGDGDGSGSGSQVRADIVSPVSSFGVSVNDEAPVSIIYTVSGTPQSISGYYVPVADSSSNSPAIGDRVIIATNLPTGTNRFFNFLPGEAGVGFFRAGVLVTLTTNEQITAESSGVIHVEGPPDPSFLLPATSLTVVERGDPVQIRFDAGDPENVVQWRLFHLDSNDPVNVPPDQLGTQIGPLGSGNIGEFTLETNDLAFGDYTLGVSATDSGASVPQTVARGDADRVVTIPNATTTTPRIRVVEPGTSGGQGPTLTFSAPGATDVNLFLVYTYAIQFQATIRQAGATGTVDIFYDRDRNPANGVTIISRDLPSATTSVNLPADLPEGTYNIGGTVRDGVNDPVTVYATGKINIQRTVTLDTTEPNVSTPVRPATQVAIKWATNAPANGGTVEVFSQRVEANNTLGPEVFIIQNQPLSVTTANFSSNQSGRFRITVRLKLTDNTTRTDAAPQDVRVSSLPPILWTGSIAAANPPYDGAIFGGANFEDNAGTTLSAYTDLDGDGNDEFVIGSRYGKPFFINPTGVGHGEAYIIYGEAGSGRLRGEFNLNSVGLPSLRGVTAIGIPTVNLSNETDGLSDIAVLPDGDNDDLPELAFGFPRTESACIDYGDNSSLDNPFTEGMCQLNAFGPGGVVILSSNNSVLADPLSRVPTIELAGVGRRFSTVAVDYTAAEITDDQFAFEEGEEGEEGACVANQTDGVPETVLGPYDGFRFYLANAAWLTLFLNGDFEPVLPPDSEFDEGCRLHFDLENPVDGCLFDHFLLHELPPIEGLIPDTGSGFIVATATPLEPRGARLLGLEPDDRFGTSITISDSGAGYRPSLVVSAPGREAMPGEVEGLTSSIFDSGIAYFAPMRNFWGPDNINSATLVPPPMPHQYTMGFESHCGAGRQPALFSRRIAGDMTDKIELVEGISDFNRDGRNDIAVGAPNSTGGRGRVYITYRRDNTIEGDFVLNKLALSPTSSERLDGMLIVSQAVAGLGHSIASGFDFNGDGRKDIAIGAPNASNGVGDVIIVFGGMGVVSPVNGISVETLLTTRGTGGAPVAARIKGNPLDTTGRFGFNVANAGDIDRDGFDDLLVSAPGATPRFDPTPTDTNDALTQPGVDADGNGQADDVPGDNALTAAGLTYVIYGGNRLDRIKTCSGTDNPCNANADCAAGQTCGLDDMTININRLGGAQINGLIVAGRRTGDRLGGGDAGDVAQGGISNKTGRGRSFGLSGAGDVDGDGRADILIGSILADPRLQPDNPDVGVQNGGEVYLLYGTGLQPR